MKRSTGTAFIFFTALLLGCGVEGPESRIMTVQGPISPDEMGKTLVHEHVLVDFIGAEATGDHRWDREEVVERVLPFLLELKERGVSTLVECTPAYIGRDPRLLRMLSERSGVRLVTNTGYYGAADNKFLPSYAHTETVDQLADRWLREFAEGIEGSGVYPGFMKIGVGPGTPLSSLHEKLIRAAARTHLRSGMPIASHTGPAGPALQEIAILEEEGVHPSAFIWVHAQSEENFATYETAASRGAWISLDGVAGNLEGHLSRLLYCRDKGILDHVLVSHDAGWYSPGEPGGGDFTPFTSLFDQLIPRLKEEGFTDDELDRILVDNPREAFTIRVRTLG